MSMPNTIIVIFCNSHKILKYFLSFSKNVHPTISPDQFYFVKVDKNSAVSNLSMMGLIGTVIT